MAIPVTGRPLSNPGGKSRWIPQYGGNWVITGDVNGDGAADIVSARNVNEGDVHYTSAAVAQNLNGSVIWQWGDPEIGRKGLHHDVACQIHDWDGDGKNEVILLADGELVELDGATGAVRRTFLIPWEASDCVVFADLSGKGRRTEVLVKTRYSQIWAYDRDGNLLWTAANPGGYRTAHQPYPIDIDRDGREEIMAGYALLNPDGTVRWTFASQKADLNRGHLDCCRILRDGGKPEDWRLVLTCCGADNIAAVDGAGRTLWEHAGYHFESINTGKLNPDIPGNQIVVDIDHRPMGESPLWVLDESGNHRGQLMTDYCRHHKLLDWTGDGFDEIVLAYARGLIDRHGERIATFATDAVHGSTAQIGDMTGDGIPDLTLTAGDKVYIYKNENGVKREGPPMLGCGVNFSYY